MGLRCLIGHDFGEMQTDRDRHERGDEVVVVIREYRECERCGHTRVISENKEVRSTATGGREAVEDAEEGAAWTVVDFLPASSTGVSRTVTAVPTGGITSVFAPMA